ncbi:MAG: alpha-(1-_3)-arabinofuranosyltransferase domain-containing protein, partial [Solirubrobacterales bacterium]
RGVRGADPWRWAAAFALAIAAVGTLNIANLGYALVPAGVIVLYVALDERRGPRELWRWTWRTGMLSALTCSAAIVVLWYSAPDISANLRTTELPEQVARTSSWFESWRGLGFWFTYPQFGGLLRANVAPYFTASGVIAASFVASLGALIGLALGRWRHRVLFGAMLLVSLVLMVGMHGAGGRSPFGELLSFAFEHSELARGFRTPYKAGAGLMLGIGALLGVAAASALAAMSSRRDGQPPPRGPRTGVRRLMQAVVVGGVVLGVVVASFPFWTGRLYPEDERFQSIPGYWDRAFDYLGAQEQPGRVLVLPASERGRYRWGGVHDNLFDGFSSLSPVVNSALPQATAESGDLVAAMDDYVTSTGYVKGTLGPILARLGVRWVLLQNDLDWQHGSVPRPSTYDPLRSDPDLRIAAKFGRPGMNTTASPRDSDAELLGEQSLPPVEVYEVAGTPSPQPRLAAAPPLLVAGGGESWPSLATAGLLDGPPVAYTGAADNDALRKLVASGSELVVTDGNRRRATGVTIGRPIRSPTLAAGETTDRAPQDLFGSPETQSVATYADARRIFASRSGNELEAPYEAKSRPANAFDRVERTAWQVRGPRDPTGEAVSVELTEPVAVTAVSVLPYADGSRTVKAVDVIAHSEEGEPTRKRLRFEDAGHVFPVARFEPTEVSAIEIRIARVIGGTGAVGITEAAIGTPNGQLDLREFVRTPDDLAIRAASDDRLGAALAARPPRYELRRITGVGAQQPSFAAQDEETELRREITVFGNHRYELGVTARIDSRAADSAIDALLAAPVGAVGTSRFGGDVERRGGLVVDDDLSTGWEPDSLRAQRLDVRFPTTEVRTVEVLVVSGPRRGSRVTGIDVAVGDDGTTSADQTLPRSGRCLRPKPPGGGCLEKHVLNVPPTNADQLSVNLAVESVARLGQLPPRVVEVRINGRGWSGLGRPRSKQTCAPLLAIDGHPVSARLPRNPYDVLGGRLLELEGCEPIRLGPGRHRIESLPGLSGAVLTASLVPYDDRPLPDERHDIQGQPGTVQLLDRSPTRLRLQVDAPKGPLLVGGMPWHEGWVAEGDELRRSPVPLDTFAAWTVEAPTAGPVTLQFQPQQTYELAIALSIGAAAWCLWRVTRRRRRRVR